MNEITVYSTNRCPYCVMMKNFLNEQNLPFKEVNVEGNPAMMQVLMKKTGQMGVPQTEINGEWVIGFDPERVLKVLSN